jgi:hypothetical protein
MSKTKNLCNGCQDNYYNTEQSGCWLYKDATIEKRKFVHINDVPPWTTQPVVTTLSCYRKPGHVAVNAEQIR